MNSERENFQTNQKQRWYRRINWRIHKQLYRTILDQVVADKASVEYWDNLYVDVETVADDRWIMMRLGKHAVDVRGGELTIEVGGALSIAQQLDGSVAVVLLPCHLEGESAEPIVLGVYDDPSHLTESALRRAINDFFRIVRVTSAMLSSTRGDRIRIGWLRFNSRFPGREKARWAATNWPAFLLGSALGAWGIYLSYAGLAASRPSNVDTNALIRSANPTLLSVEDAGWAWWNGDDERFLTLTLGNVSNLDALDPKACVLEANACKQVTTSHGLLTPKGSRLAIGRSQTIRLPVLPESQVRQHLQASLGVELDVLGWGLKPELPVDLEHSCAHRVPEAPPCVADLHSIGFPIRVEWDTTLEEQRSLNTSVYAYVEAARESVGTADTAQQRTEKLNQAE